MFATLGSITFEVLTSPESLEFARSYDYAEHKVVESKPRLQWLAHSLETIALDLSFQTAFTDPVAQLAGLRAAAQAHQAMPLTLGNGTHRGYFVITGITETSRQLSAQGDPIAISVKLTLKEWARSIEVDPNAPPQPVTTPIALAPAAGATPTSPNTGASALIKTGAAPGAPVPTLSPGDVPPGVIVRSAAA